MSFESQYAISY